MAVGLSLVLFTVTGCGDGRPGRVPVSGQVLIDGKPLTFGWVCVFPANNRMAFGEIGADGRFRLTTFDDNDGCVVGEHQVAVVASQALNGSTMKWHAPKKYKEPHTSTLVAQISGPTEDLILNLKWDGGKPFIESSGTSGKSE